jgi:hypothetical protein
MNGGVINSVTKLHLVGYFYWDMTLYEQYLWSHKFRYKVLAFVLRMLINNSVYMEWEWSTVILSFPFSCFRKVMTKYKKSIVLNFIKWKNISVQRNAYNVEWGLKQKCWETTSSRDIYCWFLALYTRTRVRLKTVNMQYRIRFFFICT